VAGPEVEAARPSNTNKRGSSRTNLSIAMGRAQLMYKSHSFSWHGHSASAGLAARAGKEAGGFTWDSRPAAFFRVIAITAIGPFSGLLRLMTSYGLS
jgi:hypothetical protein